MLLSATINGKEGSAFLSLRNVNIREDLLCPKEARDAGHQGSPQSDLCSNFVHEPHGLGGRCCDRFNVSSRLQNLSRILGALKRRKRREYIMSGVEDAESRRGPMK